LFISLQVWCSRKYMCSLSNRSGVPV
jgi:hypothetical protein